jgi:hypothetical protein
MKPNWKDAPDWAKFMALDRSGQRYWYEESQAFLDEPMWLGIRRAACPFHAYADWLVMYNAHAAIYRVKGLKVPTCRDDGANTLRADMGETLKSHRHVGTQTTGHRSREPV